MTTVELWASLAVFGEDTEWAEAILASFIEFNLNDIENAFSDPEADPPILPSRRIYQERIRSLIPLPGSEEGQYRGRPSAAEFNLRIPEQRLLFVKWAYVSADSSLQAQDGEILFDASDSGTMATYFIDYSKLDDFLERLRLRDILVPDQWRAARTS